MLRQDMKQIIINLETPEIHSLEKTGEKDAIAKVNKKKTLFKFFRRLCIDVINQKWFV